MFPYLEINFKNWKPTSILFIILTGKEGKLYNNLTDAEKIVKFNTHAGFLTKTKTENFLEMIKNDYKNKTETTVNIILNMK